MYRSTHPVSSPMCHASAYFHRAVLAWLAFGCVSGSIHASTELQWTSWNYDASIIPTEWLHAGTERDVQAAMTVAASHNPPWAVKVVGSGHSSSGIAVGPLDGPILLLSIERMTGIVTLEEDTATFWAGTTIAEALLLLAAAQRTFENRGTIAEQTLAGAVATGTHGSGHTGSLATLITEFRMVLANGSIVTASSQKDPQLFDAGRVSLGCLGVMTQITMRTVPKHLLERVIVTVPIRLAFKHMMEWSKQFKYFQLEWKPSKQSAELYFTDGAAAGARTGCKQVPTLPIPVGLDDVWGHQTACVLSLQRILGSRAFDTSPRFLETEYMVAVEDAVAAFKAYYAYQRKVWALVPHQQRYYTSLRFIQGDNIWLSPCYGRDSVSISQSVVGNESYAGNVTVMDLLNRQGLAGLMTSEYKARPHWGKVHWDAYEYLRGVYPRLDDFEKLRQELDPLGIFLNAHLEQLLQPHSNRTPVARQLLITPAGSHLPTSMNVALLPGLVLVLAIGVRIVCCKGGNVATRVWGRGGKGRLAAPVHTRVMTS